MGLMCFGIGIAVGLLVTAGAYRSNNETHKWFAVYSSTASFLVGTGLWWLLMARNAKSGGWRGAGVGALSGVVAHYVCWYESILVANIEIWITGADRGHLMDPFQGLAGAAVLSMFSLLLYGVITVPAGALAGATLGRRK